MSKSSPGIHQKIQSTAIEYHLNDNKARLILILISLACYGNTVFNDYSFDDNIPITGNAFVLKGLKGIPEILTNPYCVKCGDKVDYRPLSSIIFAIEYEFFGSNPHISHLINVLLFAGLILLVYHVLFEVFRLGISHSALPFLITLFYAVHPANTETVASIKNRDQILSMFFALGALLYSYRYLLTGGRVLTAMLALFLLLISFLSKMTLSLPITGIIFLVWMFYGFGGGKRAFYFILMLLLLSVAVISPNLIISEAKVVFIENPLVKNDSMILAMGFIFKTLWFYLKFMFFPYPFRFYYGYDMIPLIPLNIPLVVFSCFIHLGLFAYGATLFIRKQVLGLLILSYLINIFTYSNIYPVTGIVSERVLFIAGLWLIAAVLVFIWKMVEGPKHQLHRQLLRPIVIGGGAVLIVCCMLTVQRNFQWKNHLTLMEADIGHLKNSAFANYLYGRRLYEISGSQLLDKRTHYSQLAKAHLKRVVDLLPHYKDVNFLLGMIYEYDEQNTDSAFYYFKLANRQNPADNQVRFQLAKQYFFKGNNQEAEVLFNKVYRELPDDTMTLFFYAQVLFDVGKKEMALSVNEELMKLAPNTYYPYYNYGLIYKFRGELQKAVLYMEKTIQLGYADEEIKNVLLNYYLANGMNDKARELDFN